MSMDGPATSPASEVPFRISFSGHSGHLRLDPTPHTPSPIPDFVLPPAYPAESPSSVKEYLERNYLDPELHLPTAADSGRVWDVDWFALARPPLEPSAPRTMLAPVWVPPFRRGQEKLQSAAESRVWDPESVQMEMVDVFDSGTGGIAPRMPGPAKDFVRGSINNRPFRPGGLQDDAAEAAALEKAFPEGARTGDWVRELMSGGPAQVAPPGFRKGLELGQLKGYESHWKCFRDGELVEEQPASSSNDTMEKYSVQFDDLFKIAWEEDTANKLLKDGVVQQSAEEIGEQKVDALQDEFESITTLDDEKQEVDVIRNVPETQTDLDQMLSSEVQDTGREPGASGDKKPTQDGMVWALVGGDEDIVTNFSKLVPDMAIEFPFELDKFQKEAIYYLEKGESVFVAAHTSAGKTVVAEYAFALATKHCTRSVYTAPIKTISNQKYRDFSGKFDVGLLTGDVSIRPEATCLIMTTEILRSMLYRGADIIRDIEWVIFDEVHYVNDAERGVVWEEVIIMLPKHINIVLLSATVPNTVEFADWIGRTKQKKIRVTSTNKRPVPLEHCLFYSGEVYKICERDMFLAQGFKEAKDAFKKKNLNKFGVKPGSKSGTPAVRAGTQGKNPDTSNKGRDQKYPKHRNSNSGVATVQQSSSGPKRFESLFWMPLVNNLLKKSLVPVVIFCFSKNRCDKSADSMFGTDLTSSSEKSEIRVFCDKAFSRLKGSDRNLPQVVGIQSLLRRGIGVHHAGLLPIVKEVVEMLFCRGVIKVLFSTETFAMGVNAPARTVVFDSLRKFDGKEHRKLLPGEYIQMAGRAGRRGLDNIGTVIIMCRDEIPEESDLKNLIVGKPTRLESQFRLTYTMILHLLRVEELKVEDMLKRSFAEFHAQKNLPEKEKLLLQMLRQPTRTIECIKGEPSIEEYYEMTLDAEAHREYITEAIMQLPNSQQFLTPGRLVVVKSDSDDDHLLGVILKNPSALLKKYVVLVLTGDCSSSALAPEFNKNEKGPVDFQGGQFIVLKGKRGMDDEYFSSVSSRKASGVININLPYKGDASGMGFEVRAIENKEIISICSSKIKIDQVRLLEEPNKTAYSRTVQQLIKEQPDGTKYPPALDAIKDLKMKDMYLVESYRAYHILLQKMSENKCHGCIKLKEHISLMREQKMYKDQLNELKFQMSDEALQQMPEFQGRIDVLKVIHYIDSDLVVQLKGRVACEMNSGEELISTECLFENQLDDLEPEEAVAIMSAFVFQQRNASEPSLTPKLAEAKKRLYDTAIKLGKLQSEFKVPVDPEEYARDNLKFGLVEVVYEWAKGTPFADICELTDVSEGIIVRTIVRLDETCREFRNAASIMGNSALFKKMEVASNAIKRDIVFAASLYVTGI
ncbi:DExH-box ATP-dependent RNA helicase DExH11 [Zea mays]|uniref:DExH-box ATP-dependent RNA helicase DExH11 n=2 Tax=Zea mays TaxID=4577 RepID=A0A1D6H182_MAIZE|nr:DExH-box ATP-dependent RNA helicase DExH11 [Zea mays]AQK68646.1 DExH-box ATP-dependent RNA helicase DExH11 [Zea mays]|eukprot:XP_008644120.1 DExH-box ATP-dependent RNA helicase DExH11 isoform X2 [Zea mays]